MAKKSLIVLVGPTAIGKTSLSIALAKTLNCPIISADSRQFFREMNIGIAKPDKEEMQGVPHYFIDSHAVTEEYNVGKFEQEAIDLLEKLFQNQNTVLMVGGSGLYIDAVCKGFDKLPEANEEIREKIKAIYETKGMEGIQELLKDLDPSYYSKVDLKNKHRVSRAIEVCLSTGISYSSLREGKAKLRNFKIIKIGLNTSREVIYSRINKRVDEMMKQGLLQEVKSLQIYKGLNALQTVGYKELFEYLDGKSDLNSAVDQIKKNTRNFAKRQLTWFRKDTEIKWFEPNELIEITEYLSKSGISFIANQTD